MSKEGAFLVYCIERYRFYSKLTGAEAMELFEKYNVDDYITENYEALHTVGEKYLINDINEYIALRKRQ